MPRLAPEHWRTLEAVFLAAGFRFVRQEGSHRAYAKPGVARPVVIPAYREVPVFVIRNNLNSAGVFHCAALGVLLHTLRRLAQSGGILVFDAPPVQ
jgi:predicted RNA binding protein YcfA (HicA-like mRNA interferase family)